MQNSYLIRGNIAVIYIYSKGERYECWVDAEDLDKVNEFPFTWFRNAAGYIWGNTSRKAGKRTAYFIHRLITDAPNGMHVDHINGNRMDNRKSNLRIVTNAQNSQNRNVLNQSNRSGYRGVIWVERDQKWQAQIKVNGKNTYLGQFEDPKEASKVVKEARSKMMPYSKEGMECTL